MVKTFPIRNVWMIFVALMLLCSCSEPVEQPVTAAVPKVIELRFGHDMPIDSSQHAAAERFAELIKQRSDGRIAIKIYPKQQLGTDRQMLDMAQRGELDIILPPTAKLSHILPQFQVFDLPFLFPDSQSVHQITDSRRGENLLAAFSAHNLIGVTFWDSGFKQLSSNKPIRTVADFKGQRFRIMESQVLQDQFTFWGAGSVFIDFNKTYKVLKNQVVDGQENPLNSMVSKGFHNVQKYLYLTNHGYLGQILTFSKPSFDKLDAASQQMLIDTAKEVTPWQRAQSKERHQKRLELVKAHDINVSTLPEEVMTFMRQQATLVMEKHRLTFGTELIEAILQTIDAKKSFADDQLVIALDADLQGNSALSGLAIRRGIEIAIDEINQSGGVLGKRLTLTARDNSMIPARGLDNLSKFAQIDNLLAVFTGISSPVVLSQLEFIHKNKILTLDPWAAATPIIDNGYQPNYVFRVSVRDEYAADFLLQHALTVSNNVGLLLVDNGWGRSNHRALIAALEKQSLQPTATQWFEWGKKDFSDAIEQLYRAGSDVLIYVGNPVEAGKIVSNLSRRDNPLPIISHWGITGGYFAQQNAEALKKVDLRILQTFSFIDNQHPKVLAFVEKYKRKYSVSAANDIVAPVGTAHAYDLTHLLIKAVKRANSVDMSKVRTAMESIEYHQGLVKEYGLPFNQHDHDALERSDFILTRYKDHYLVPLGYRR